MQYIKIQYILTCKIRIRVPQSIGWSGNAWQMHTTPGRLHFGHNPLVVEVVLLLVLLLLVFVLASPRRENTKDAVVVVVEVVADPPLRGSCCLTLT